MIKFPCLKKSIRLCLPGAAHMTALIVATPCTIEPIVMRKQHVRKRSVGNVIEELKIVKERGKAKLILFNDEVFTSSMKWLEEFSERYPSEVGIPYFCSVHPGTIKKKTAELLKKSGCRSLAIGVQSGSERIRKEIFNRHISNKQIIEAISYLKEAGILVYLDNIFGAPTENEADLEECVKLYLKLRPDRIQTHRLTYFPGTEIISLRFERKLHYRTRCERYRGRLCRQFTFRRFHTKRKNPLL